MEILKTAFAGLYLIQPTTWNDNRGYFFESFNSHSFRKLNVKNWVQDNEAYSTQGVLRGLHYQVEPMAQTKLVRAVSGEVIDVVVDMREESQTWGKHIKIRLSGNNKIQVFIPAGFAHGYLVVSDEAIVSYKCNKFYSETHQASVRYDDPFLNIDWEVPHTSLILSEKDRNAPYWQDRRKDSSLP